MTGTIVCGFDDRTAPAVARIASDLAAELDDRLVLARVNRRGHSAVELDTGVVAAVPGGTPIPVPDGIAADPRIEVGRPAETLARVAADE
jgi:hypothetical protein